MKKKVNKKVEIIIINQASRVTHGHRGTGIESHHNQRWPAK